MKKMTKKLNVKDHLTDQDTLDLSMCDLEEVPVKEIAAIPKAKNLDLTNNSLTSLGKNFPSSLTHLVKLELCHNKLQCLPDNFGLLVNLRHLDLYMNQLATLPLSFGQLRALRWLDLKGNPLVAKMAQIAGPCLNNQQCQQAAKNVVGFLSDMSLKVEEDKLRRQRERQIEEETAKKEAKKKEAKKKKKKKKSKISEGSNDLTENGKHSLEPTDAEDDFATNGNSNASNQRSKCGKVVALCSALIKFFVISVLLVFLIVFIISLIDESTYRVIKVEFDRLWKIASAKLPESFNSHLQTATESSKKYGRLFLENSRVAFRAFVVKLHEWYVWFSTDEKVQLYIEIVKHYWHVAYIKMSEFLMSFSSFMK